MGAEKTIAERELRNNVSGILRRVEAGESFVITVSGRSVAQIRPLPASPRRGNQALLDRILADAPLDSGFRQDVADAVDQEIRSR